jgi:tetratricopeptide (TPR) repeat protein
MEQYETAKGPFREAIRLKPDNADAISGLGVAHFRLKQYQQAAALFQKAIEIAPGDGRLYHNLGKSYFFMGRKQEAQRIYEKLLAIDKDWAQQLYEAMNKDAGPKAAPAASATATRPNSTAGASARTLVAQGDQYREAKDFAKAIEAYKKAARLAPKDYRAHYLIGVTYIDMAEGLTDDIPGSFDRMKQYHDNVIPALEKAINLKPGDLETLRWLAHAYLVVQQDEAAESAAREAIRLGPDDTDANYLLGLACVRLRKKDEAIQIYRKLLRLNKEAAQQLYSEINKAK